jgi:DinB superfamily
MERGKLDVDEEANNMTDWVQWFREQLKASGDGFVWAFQQIEPVLHQSFPPKPGYLGTWSPARHVWHVTEYERCQVLPSMRQWLGGSLPAEDAWPDNDAAWSAVQNRTSDEFAAAYLDVRQQQIRLLDQLTSVDWTVPRETLWGMKPLSMVVTKTYQHTFEHGDTLLRMGIWWRSFEAQNR